MGGAAAAAATAAAVSIFMACVLGGSGMSVEQEGKNETICLCRLGPGRTRGTRERTRALSVPTHFGSKSEVKMGARPRYLFELSRWVAISLFSCWHGHIQTRMIVWMSPLEKPLLRHILVYILSRIESL
jgi:hypothetical protein